MSQRGFTVFSALLALALFGLMLVSAIRWLEEWSYARRHVSAAQDLVVLARGARAHAANDLEAMRTATGSLGLREVAVTGAGSIQADGWLGSGFRTTNTLGQGYRVFHRRTGTDGLDVLVTTVTPAGLHVGYRLELGFEGGREIFVGVVDDSAATRLRGPAVDADVSGYQAQYGEPSVGESAALTGLTLRSVYGSELHRTVVPGRPEANEMATDLRMAGHDITGAELIESEEAEIADEVRALGGLEVVNTLTVGQRLVVTGESVFQGDLTARDATFAGELVSDSAAVTNDVRAQTLEIAGEVTAATVRATTAMTAPDVTATDVHAQTVVGDAVRSADVRAREVRSHLVRAGTVRGDSGVYRQIHTGSCTGC